MKNLSTAVRLTIAVPSSIWVGRTRMAEVFRGTIRL